ncbi:hypothetical protein BG418_15550 [Streptomyces sp. CBMA152]|nr:2OG-Fe dioxygenase family protein [Streptomyces sp. CBMA152]MBD0742884.1 hypothetical protein [Streptomyces sp. CBMA152]
MFVNGDRFALAKAFSRFRTDSHDTWEALPADPYAPPDTGRYRRYGRLLWQGNARAGRFRGRLLRVPHLPYHQKAEFNALAGGIDRTFAPLPDHISGSALVRRLLRFDLAAAGAGQGLWEVDMHMVRIAPGPGGLGRPAPEGVHRDGLDAIAIHLIEASGVEGGVSSVFDDEGRELGRVRLTRPLDSLLVDDRRLRHFTTPVRRRHTVVTAGPSRGWRDVLLVGMRRSTSVDGPTTGTRRNG